MIVNIPISPKLPATRAADYEVNLEANLLDLLDRIKSGRYRAPPVRRAYIRTRPFGDTHITSIPAAIVDPAR